MEEDFIFDFSTEDFNTDYLEDDVVEEEIVEDDNQLEQTEQNKPIEDESSEEVDEEDNDEEDDDSESADEDSSSDIFSSLASFAQEQGILSSSFDLSKYEIKTSEDFSKVLNEEINSRVEYKLNEYIENTDIQKIKQHFEDIKEIQNISGDDFKDNLDFAKRIIEQDLKNQNLPDRVFKNYMRQLGNLDEEALIEEALNSKESILSYNKQKADEEFKRYEEEKVANEQRAIEELNLLKSSIYDNKELLPGFIPNKTVRDKVFDTLTTVVGHDKNGNPVTKLGKDSVEDPIGFQIKLYTIYELTNGFKDLDKIAARQKSNATKELEKAFKNKPDYSSGPSYKIDKNSYDSPLKYDELNI